MDKWTREHDAEIAKKEGWLEIGLDRIPHYNQSLMTVLRSAEVWRTKDPDTDRIITIRSAVDRMGRRCTVELAENYTVGPNYEWRTFKGEGDSYAEALAWALYEAVKTPTSPLTPTNT